MPIVIICGYPSSGKSKRSKELKEFLSKEHNVSTIIINDGKINRNHVYNDSKCEITARASLKSSAERHTTNSDVVILDSLNYVKGYRYELHCLAKYVRTSHCVIYCDVSKEDVFKFNQQKNEEERYNDDILEALIARFEAPDGMARWDNPLFTTHADEDLPFVQICNALFGSKIPVQNLSTQNPPLMSPTFLYEADKTIQLIGASILASQKNAALGDAISLPTTNETYTFQKTITTGDMRRYRKQFLIYLRSNPVKDASEVPKTFLHFIGY